MHGYNFTLNIFWMKETFLVDCMNQLYYNVKYINIIQMLELTLFAAYPHEIHCHEYSSESVSTAKFYFATEV